MGEAQVRVVEFAFDQPDVTQLGLRHDDTSHSTVPQLDSLELRLVEKRTRQLAIDRQHVNERETPKLRAGQHDSMQLAASEANPIRTLTRQICIGHALVFPHIL